MNTYAPVHDRHDRGDTQYQKGDRVRCITYEGRRKRAIDTGTVRGVRGEHVSVKWDTGTTGRCHKRALEKVDE